MWVKSYNEKARAESRRELPELSREKLVEVTRRIGERSQVTFGDRSPTELVGDDSTGAQRLNQWLDQYFDESRRAVDERFGVFSMAKRPNNILMWSHYAADHTGICIEFDTEAHPEAFPNAHAVRYKEESPVIRKRFANVLMNLRDEERSLDEAFLARLTDQDVKTQWTDREIRTWFLTKSSLWEYENEWRSIVPGPGLRRIPAATISGVVIGCRADLETEETVRAWVKRRRQKVTLSRAVKKKGAFALDVVPI